MNVQPSLTVLEDLKALGLTETQGKVYLAILSLGEPTVGGVERITHLHKQLIYNAATKLQETGLIAIRELRGRKRFSAENPEQLEARAREQLKAAQSVVPRLHELANADRAEEKVRMYRGEAGVRQYYLDSIRRQPKHSTVSILGVDSKRYFSIFPPDEFHFQRFEAVRDEKTISLQLLLAGTQETEIALNRSRRLLQLKSIEENVYGPMDLMIWHEHVGMLFYGPEPYVISIIGKETVQGFSEYYQVLWNMSRSS